MSLSPAVSSLPWGIGVTSGVRASGGVYKASADFLRLGLTGTSSRHGIVAVVNVVAAVVVAVNVVSAAAAVFVVVRVVASAESFWCVTCYST